MRPEDVAPGAFATRPSRPRATEADEDAPRPPDGRLVFLLRLAGTLAAATAFVSLCWLVGGSVNGDLRILAGPVLLLRTQGVEDHLIGAAGLAVLLPGMFAVGIRVNVVTVVLAPLAALGWLAVGLFIEAIASC